MAGVSMSLIRKIPAIERRDYGGGIFSNPLGLEPGQIPTNGQLAYIDGNGYPISTKSALRYWPVWACIRILADTISTLPIDVYDKNGDELEPFPARLTKPSAYATRLQWTWQVMASLCLRGNAYGLIASFDRLEYPTQVDLVSPDCVKIKKDEHGHILYVIDGHDYTSDTVWHLPGPQFPGEIEGMSPITYASRTIGIGIDAEKFSGDIFSNGIKPSAVLQSDQQINDDQAKMMKKRVKDGAANRDMVVLGAGLKLQPWQLSAQDAQYVETQQLNTTAIAEIFGVPPEMIGAFSGGTSLTYANREQRAQDFLTNAINPWLARLEEALSAWFPRGTYVKFNTGGLLRSDLMTRYESYDIGIHSNVLLPSEARAFEDLPVIPGLDDKPLPQAKPTTAPAPAKGQAK